MWQAARRWSTWTTSAFVVLALAGCGKTWHATFQSSGYGKDQYWLVRARGHAKAVVVLLHGLSRDSGEQLQGWQAHLAGEGYDVIYPRYEEPPPDPYARNNIVGAVGRALGDLGRPNIPLVLIGHSRGGRLAVESAAFLDPKLVLAFFPGLLNAQFELATNLALIPHTTDVWLFVGDRDTTVGATGARQLERRLAAAGFPLARTHESVIHSNGFVADHDSVYDTGAAAQTAIWDRADMLIKQATTRAARR